jgi:hypothetical protein
MKLSSIVIAFFASIAPALAQVSITGFGSGDFNYDAGFSSGVTNTSQTATSFTATLADSSAQLAATFTASASIPANGALSLTANLGTNPGSTFILELYDINFAAQRYDGNWNNFTTGVSSTATLSFGPATSGFDFAHVTSMILSTGGGPTSPAFTVTFDQLSAVPEPSTYAAIVGAAGLALAIVKRRKRVDVLRV